MFKLFVYACLLAFVCLCFFENVRMCKFRCSYVCACLDAYSCGSLFLLLYVMLYVFPVCDCVFVSFYVRRMDEYLRFMNSCVFACFFPCIFFLFYF